MNEDAEIRTLTALHAAEAVCRRCDLYRDATQAVPGEGPQRARLMLVGEQPGDQEDIAGHPFVGPAGKMLDRALADAGLDRTDVFVTNAVKHFKFEQRGKRRLHKKPSTYEIDRCRWWNELERTIVRPDLLVALGATAARSLLGRPATIARLRGKVLSLPDGGRLIVTIHPSYLLRLKDEPVRTREYDGLVADLARGAALLGAAP